MLNKLTITSENIKIMLKVLTLYLKVKKLYCY
jgi:hypothetical protein